MSVFAHLYRLLYTQFWGVLAGTVMLVAGCAFFTATLVVHEDITSLMPQKPAGLAGQFELLRDAPHLQGITIAVGGADPIASANLLAKHLPSPEIPRIITGAEGGISPLFMLRLCVAAPGLMDASAMGKLPGLVDGASVREAVQRDVRLMRSAQGIALRDLIAVDPLGICASTLKGLAPKQDGGAVRFDQGSLTSADGRYALVMAEPALSMADSAAAHAVMVRVRKAVAELPKDTPVHVLGGHRHTEENANVIRQDMERILPLSLGLLVLTYLIFVRTWRGLAIVVLPGVALLAAAASTGLVYGGVSGIVLGFGSVILGIAADYAIHVYYALRSGEDVPDVLTRLAPPMLFGAGTTLVAFLAFFSSSIPCIVQMSFFVGMGIVSAVFLALVVLPHLIAPKTPPLVPQPLYLKSMRFRKRPLFFLWCVLAVGLVMLLWHVPVNGDIRALSYTSAALRQDERIVRESFGGLRERGQFAVRGATMQEALSKNDALWASLQTYAAQSGWDLSLMTSLASILPSDATQIARHAAWESFWAEHADTTLQNLDAAAARAGFAPDAFVPFKDWIRTMPPLINPNLLREGGLAPVVMLAREHFSSAMVYGLVQGETLPDPVLDILHKHDAAFVSGATFRSAMDEATRSDLVRFGSLSLLAILGMSALIFRSPVRMGMTLLPVGVALCVTLGLFRLADMSLNIFHAVALPLVICLSVDYGIFILANLEGKLNRESRMGVLLSGITTLSGFGVLLLADHPALFSLGLTVSVGLTGALLTAFALLPCFVRPAPAGPDSVKDGAA